MSFFDLIKGLFGLVPSAIEAGKQVADAVKPAVVIDPNDATLWHTFQYDKHVSALPGLKAYWCNVCQEYTTGGLCSEAVRRRNAGIS